MSKRFPAIRLDERGRACVAQVVGTTHHRCEDRYRLLTADIPLVARQGRGELFAVFDGIGGAPQGMRAAQAMVDGLVGFFDPAVPATWQGLRDHLYRVNVEVFSWGFMPGTDRPLGGCAGTVAWLSGDDLYLFHAGDTVGMLLLDHGYEVLTRLHEAAGGIYRYFGKGETLEIEVAHRRVSDGDRVLLVSDGLTKVLDYQQMDSIVREAGDPPETARELAEQAQTRGSPDDITAMVVEIYA